MKLSEYFSNASKWHQKANFRDAEGKKLEITDGALDHELRLTKEKRDEMEKKGERIPINRELVVSCCLWGAIQYCYEGFNAQNLIVLKLTKALKIQESVYSLVLWNDDPGRKFEDIKALVDKCGV
jgi:hypothetical protein